MVNNLWAQRIADLQLEDGSWGRFHTLSTANAKHQPITTEQALRRLRALGLTKEDEPIRKALDYMRGCLRGERQPPDGREKVINWDAFEALMLATWIRVFEPDDPLAAPIARQWADLISTAFAGGAFSMDAYASAYRTVIPKLHSGERLIDHTSFYMVSLLKGELEPDVESAYVDMIIHNDHGIYYVYPRRIADPPDVLASRQTVNYLAALELLSGYSCAPQKLRFAVDWLLANQVAQGEWDLGKEARDGVYFPVSASWRSAETRKRDCTQRIEGLLGKLD